MAVEFLMSVWEVLNKPLFSSASEPSKAVAEKPPVQQEARVLTKPEMLRNVNKEIEIYRDNAALFAEHGLYVQLPLNALFNQREALMTPQELFIEQLARSEVTKMRHADMIYPTSATMNLKI